LWNIALTCFYFWSYSIVYYYETEENFRKIYLLSLSGGKLAQQLLGLYVAEREILSHAI
jgi:hypothetical protein